MSASGLCLCEAARFTASGDPPWAHVDPDLPHIERQPAPLG